MSGYATVCDCEERMIRTLKSESGMALALALGALVIIGVLAAGAMWAGTQDYRIAANTVRQTGAEATAELGVNRLLATWQTSWNTGKPIGDTLRRTYTMAGNGSALVTATQSEEHTSELQSPVHLVCRPLLA